MVGDDDTHSGAQHSKAQRSSMCKRQHSGVVWRCWDAWLLCCYVDLGARNKQQHSMSHDCESIKDHALRAKPTERCTHTDHDSCHNVSLLLSTHTNLQQAITAANTCQKLPTTSTQPTACMCSHSASTSLTTCCCCSVGSALLLLLLLAAPAPAGWLLLLVFAADS